MARKAKYHVVKISTSGLGDAIKAVLAGALYCEISDRILVVDWRRSLYSIAQENTFYSLFDLKGIRYSREFPSDIDVAPLRWKGKLDLSMHETYTMDGWSTWNRKEAIENYSIDFSQIDFPNEVTVSWDFDQASKLLPHFPKIEKSIELFAYAAKKYLTIDSDVLSRVVPVVESLPENYLAVHIRATKEFTANKGSVPLKRTFGLISSNIKSDGVFFLASDNVSVRDSLQSQYSNMVTVDKWFANSGEALHLDSNCPDKLANAKSALVDILLLANGKTLICNPNSCFAECAHYFSPHKNQRVVSVLYRKLSQRLFDLIKSKIN